MKTQIWTREALLVSLWSGVAAGMALFAIMAQQGAGQVDDEPQPSPPGVTKKADTLFFVGKVSTITETSMTVVIDDTDEKTFRTTTDTEILLNGKPAKLDDLQTADVVRVTAGVGTSNIADAIVAARPENVSKPKPNVGARRDDGDKEGRSGDRRYDRSVQTSNQSFVSGQLFVAQLHPDSDAALAGLRPGDMILLVGPQQTFGNADAVLRGLRIQRTDNVPAIIIDGVPGNRRPAGIIDLTPGVVVPGVQAPGTIDPNIDGTNDTGTTDPIPGDSNQESSDDRSLDNGTNTPNTGNNGQSDDEVKFLPNKQPTNPARRNNGSTPRPRNR